MRWLFLFVLLLNLAYFGWEYSRSTEGNGIMMTQPDVPAIVLLSEKAQFDAGQKVGAAAALVEADKAPVVVSEKAVKTVEVPVQEPIQKPVQADQRADSCYTLGPFHDLDELRGFTRLIKDYVVNASFRARDEVEQSMYRVYLGPAEGYEKAKAMSQRLKQKKITEHYVVAKGPRENSISLGHFKVKDSAYAHADNIKKQGFDAKVEPVFKNYKLYWLDYRLAEGRVIPEGYFKSKLDSRVTRLDRDCS